jgi:NADH-quinone oxidoreductase subunit J
MAIGTIIVLGVLALVIIGSAVGLLISRNTVYAALFLIINFIAVGMLYLALGAPFIAIAQVTVYAGSIMVLFLFVIMLLGAEKLPTNEPIKAQRPLGILAGAAFLVEVVLYFFMRANPVEVLSTAPVDFANPASIGALLFNSYMLPFEVVGAVLLVATVGAIILSRDDRVKAPKAPARIEEPKE